MRPIVLVSLLLVARGFGAEVTLKVFAAASLKEAFTTIAQRYEANRRGIRVTLNFSGSQTLAAQIRAGAPCDVFASAAMKNLDEAGAMASSKRIFARNRLTIVLRRGYALSSYKQLDKVPRLVLAAKNVPAGGYAREFLSRAQKDLGDAWRRAVDSHVVSNELDIRSAMAKVQLGEADAAIVYRSDARSAKGGLREVAIPNVLNPIAEYPVALTRSANRELGGDFIRFLLTSEPQEILRRFGFLSAPRGERR